MKKLVANVDIKGVVIVGVVIYLLSVLLPAPLTVSPQAILNVEQEKSATLLIGLTSQAPDTDASDGNLTQNFGAYRIVTSNGTVIRDWSETQVSTSYQVTVDYAPLYNSTVQARINEKLFSYNATTNTSTFVSEHTLVTQNIDINVVSKQAAPVVVTSSSGSSWTPVNVGTPIKISAATPPTQETVVVEESFGEKYGLLILLIVSLLVFGLAIYSYIARRGRRRR